MTTCDFELVAYAVTVRIVEAVAIAVVAFFGIRARTVFVGCVLVVVARFSVLTTCDFELVAYAVTVRVVEAVAIAVVAGIWSIAFAVACAFCDSVTATHATLVELEA